MLQFYFFYVFGFFGLLVVLLYSADVSRIPNGYGHNLKLHPCCLLFVLSSSTIRLGKQMNCEAQLRLQDSYHQNTELRGSNNLVFILRQHIFNLIRTQVLHHSSGTFRVPQTCTFNVAKLTKLLSLTRRGLVLIAGNCLLL